MGPFGLRRNFPFKMVHLQRWSSWTVGPVRPKLPVPFPKIFVFSPTLLSSNQNFGRNANGSFRCDWKRYFNRTMLLHFVFITPLIMRVWFGKWKALIACDAGGPRTHSLDHWYSPSNLRIAHVRYIKILTWLRGLGFLCFPAIRTRLLISKTRTFIIKRSEIRLNCKITYTTLLLVNLFSQSVVTRKD